MEETILYTKYALLTPSDYLRLNEALSERMGFELGGATARLAPINPPLAIVGETILCVLMLDTEVQEKCADLLEGFELVDNFIPYSEPQELVATDLTQTQVDWTVSHAEETGVTVEVNESEVIVNPENNE